MTAADTDLALARVEAEALLTDTCKITRKGERVFNPQTGRYDIPTVTVWEGRCAIRSRTHDVREALAAGLDVDESTLILKLPVRGTEGVQSNDTVTVTASAHDAALVGGVFRVKAQRRLSHATLRRIPIEEVTAG